MSDLDKKLKGVLSMVHIGYKSSDGECNTTLTQNQVASYVMLSIRELGYMTGQEWYDKFVNYIQYEEFEDWADKDIALKSAKKAAGIE